MGTWSFPFEALWPQEAGREIEFLLRFAKDSPGFFSENGTRRVRTAKLTTAHDMYSPVVSACIRFVEIDPGGICRNGIGDHTPPPAMKRSFQRCDVVLPALQFSPMLVSFHGHDCLNFVVTWSWKGRMLLSSSCIDILQTICFLSQGLMFFVDYSERRRKKARHHERLPVSLARDDDEFESGAVADDEQVRGE